MHQVLYNHIAQQITDASTFVLRHMPIDLSIDEIYESLLDNKDVAQAFANAARFLPPSSLNRRLTVAMEDYGPLSLNLRLSPTDKYPMFLMARASTYGPFLTRGSPLSRALALPIRVARDWKMLTFTFNKLTNEVDDGSALACVMPWIREHVAQWAKENPFLTGAKSKDYLALHREVRVILSGRAPKHFPCLTEQLNGVCRSGITLFSQYRMLSASPVEVSPVILDKADINLPDWLSVHLDEVLDDWHEEKNLIRDKLETIRKRKR